MFPSGSRTASRSRERQLDDGSFALVAFGGEGGGRAPYGEHVGSRVRPSARVTRSHFGVIGLRAGAARPHVTLAGVRASGVRCAGFAQPRAAAAVSTGSEAAAPCGPLRLRPMMVAAVGTCACQESAPKPTSCRRPSGFGRWAAGAVEGGFARSRARATSVERARRGASASGRSSSGLRGTSGLRLRAVRRRDAGRGVRRLAATVILCSGAEGQEDRRSGYACSRSRRDIRKTSGSAPCDAGSNDGEGGSNQCDPTDVPLLRGPGEPHERTRRLE